MKSSTAPVKINGWAIYAHPFFLDTVEALVAEVGKLKQKDPAGYQSKKQAKLLAAIVKLAFEVIPANPELTEYRLGATLGDDRKHWFRAKFFQQYRLFFRFRKAERLIVLVWVNDDDTKRAYGSATDAYRMFGKMLDRGNPPDDWDALKTAAVGGIERLKGVLSETTKSK